MVGVKTGGLILGTQPKIKLEIIGANKMMMSCSMKAMMETRFSMNFLAITSK